MVTSDTLKTFGLEVRAARVAAGWTLAQLAQEALGNPDRKGYVSQIENGRKQITPLTVGKLAEALDLSDAIVRPVISNEASVADDVTQQDERAERLIAASENDGETGVAEGLMIALAYEYAEGDTSDLDTAYRGLKAALETAKDMAERAKLPDNTDAAMSAIRAEVQRFNEDEKLDDANARIEEAIAQKQAEVAALLDLGLQQDRIRNDPQSAANRAFERVRLEGGTDLFNALRQEQDRWYVIGRDKALPFDAIVAIHLAELSKRVAKTADEKGAALNDLGTALAILGERESSASRLEQAVDAYTDALQERTRDRVPLDWAMTKMNLGNALQKLGQRESDTARLEQAVDAYTDALLEYTKDHEPLNWATTKNNLGNALLTLGEWGSDTARLEQAVDALTDALQERTRDRVPLDWAMTKNNIGNALSTLGERESSTTRLEQAVGAYTDALLEHTKERVPFQWALTQENLAIMKLSFFEKTGDAAYLDQATVHAKDAREVYVEAQADFYMEKIAGLITDIQSRWDAL